MKNIEVIPSLPAATFEELRTKIEKVRGLVSGFQIDICDGKFVEFTSWPMRPENRAQFERIAAGEEELPFKNDFQFELDMMVHQPESMLADWIQAGISRALIHIEAEHDFDACRKIADGKIELGVALTPGTPVSRIDEYISHITVVQLMGIAVIGKQGQPFDPRVLDMIRATKERYPSVIIEIDGAVNKDTAPQLVEAGAMRLAPGSFVLNSDDPKIAVEILTSLRT